MTNCAPALGVLVLLSGAGAARAATIEAGTGTRYPRPSAAIAAAHAGDTVLIAPGTYYDCAIVHRDDLTIAGSGPGVVMTDRTCAGKAILVINSNDVTIRDLTLQRARVPDGNGAGIRAEGGNLTVDHVRFINNQDGILAASKPDNTLIVRDSTFERNGPCDSRCGHGIDAGRLKLLRVTSSVFRQPQGGDHVYSGAKVTELAGDHLIDRAGTTNGPLVFVHDSALVLKDNTVVLGESGSSARPGAVLAVGHATSIVVRGNSLHEAGGAAVPLLRNWTGQTVQAADNSVPPGSVAVSDSGSLYHRLRSRLADIRNRLHAMAGRAKRGLAAALRKLH